MADAFSRGVTETAKRLCDEDAALEEEERGALAPSRQLPMPIGEGGYTADEYAMMERDRGKYLLYMAALRGAASDFIARTNDKPLRIAVVGCGRGRLIEFALDAHVKAEVHAIA